MLRTPTKSLIAEKTEGTISEVRYRENAGFLLGDWIPENPPS